MRTATESWLGVYHPLMHHLPIFFTAGCTGVNGELSLWLGATGLETVAPLGHGSLPGSPYFCIAKPFSWPISLPPAHGPESSSLTTPTALESQAPGFLFVLVYFHKPLLRASTQALEHLEVTETSLGSVLLQACSQLTFPHGVRATSANWRKPPKP